MTGATSQSCARTTAPTQRSWSSPTSFFTRCGPFLNFESKPGLAEPYCARRVVLMFGSKSKYFNQFSQLLIICATQKKSCLLFWYLVLQFFDNPIQIVCTQNELEACASWDITHSLLGFKGLPNSK